MEKFKIIIITAPSFINNEGNIINSLFNAGLERLHIRKPKGTLSQTEELIESIDSQFHNRLVLHDYHELAIKYSHGGIHLNSRNPFPPKGWNNSNGITKLKTLKNKIVNDGSTSEIIINEQHNRKTISCSCHSLDELAAKKNEYDYLSLSPIFNSISKHGYSSAFTSTELKEAKEKGIIDNRVYALGGVDANNISQLKDYGFGGAMLLGYIWEENEESQLYRFNKIKQQ